MKSACASRAAKVINPELRITASEVPVGEDTEDTFNEEFWKVSVPYPFSPIAFAKCLSLSLVVQGYHCECFG